MAPEYPLTTVSNMTRLAIRRQSGRRILPCQQPNPDRTRTSTRQRRLQIPLSKPKRGDRLECPELLLPLRKSRLRLRNRRRPQTNLQAVQRRQRRPTTCSDITAWAERVLFVKYPAYVFMSFTFFLSLDFDHERALSYRRGRWEALSGASGRNI